MLATPMGLSSKSLNTLSMDAPSERSTVSHISAREREIPLAPLIDVTSRSASGRGPMTPGEGTPSPLVRSECLVEQGRGGVSPNNDTWRGHPGPLEGSEGATSMMLWNHASCVAHDVGREHDAPLDWPQGRLGKTRGLCACSFVKLTHLALVSGIYTHTLRWSCRARIFKSPELLRVLRGQHVGAPGQDLADLRLGNAAAIRAPPEQGLYNDTASHRDAQCTLVVNALHTLPGNASIQLS